MKYLFEHWCHLIFVIHNTPLWWQMKQIYMGVCPNWAKAFSKPVLNMAQSKKLEGFWIVETIFIRSHLGGSTPLVRGKRFDYFQQRQRESNMYFSVYFKQGLLNSNWAMLLISFRFMAQYSKTQSKSKSWFFVIKNHKWAKNNKKLAICPSFFQKTSVPLTEPAVFQEPSHWLLCCCWVFVWWNKAYTDKCLFGTGLFPVRHTQIGCNSGHSDIHALQKSFYHASTTKKTYPSPLLTRTSVNKTMVSYSVMLSFG